MPRGLKASNVCVRSIGTRSWDIRATLIDFDLEPRWRPRCRCHGTLGTRALAEREPFDGLDNCPVWRFGKASQNPMNAAKSWRIPRCRGVPCRITSQDNLSFSLTNSIAGTPVATAAVGGCGKLKGASRWGKVAQRFETVRLYYHDVARTINGLGGCCQGLRAHGCCNGHT